MSIIPTDLPQEEAVFDSLPISQTQVRLEGSSEDQLQIPNLPEELLEMIFFHLGRDELLKVRRSCRMFKAIIQTSRTIGLFKPRISPTLVKSAVPQIHPLLQRPALGFDTDAPNWSFEISKAALYHLPKVSSRAITISFQANWAIAATELLRKRNSPDGSRVSNADAFTGGWPQLQLCRPAVSSLRMTMSTRAKFKMFSANVYDYVCQDTIVVNEDGGVTLGDLFRAMLTFMYKREPGWTYYANAAPHVHWFFSWEIAEKREKGNHRGRRTRKCLPETGPRLEQGLPASSSPGAEKREAASLPQTVTENPKSDAKPAPADSLVPS